VHGSVATFAGRPAVIGALQDISERAHAERERQRALDELNATASRLAKVNRALRTLSAGNETLVRSTDEATLLREMCRVIVEAGGYRFAAVGYVQPGEGHPIAPQASAGIPFEELRHILMPRVDPGYSGAPPAHAVRAGAPHLYQDPANDPALAAWRELIVRHELASALSMPLRASEQSKPYGVLVIGASDRDAFDPEAIRLLEELANDLAFGIGILRLREDQRASAAALRKSLEDTILAIAATTEMRDPYTAGHERRVAELAACIAQEMGLAEPAIEGIRFGAMIHDLGKIKIPAEILVKPTRLTPIEYELIKQHAQAGYDILKGIDFPWPVAQMVLQHHERFDGSGYPQGLKGDAVIREARILAVADVVEAMSSHRPYRPGLGVDKALAEIGRGRGTLYDPQAVDACLRMFREKGYTLPA
jgi:putative nucleotidyltransferase with HDIG domain